MRACHAWGIAAAIVLSGCATAPVGKPKELGAGVRSVTLVQHGEEPLRYVVGGVDGKTSWAGGGMAFTPASSARVDAQAALGPNLVFAIGQNIAREAMKDDPDYYARLLTKMIASRKLTNEAAPRVFPELAGAWGVPYDRAAPVQVAAGMDMADAQGRYAGTDPGTDLVLAFGIEQLLLSEKPTLSVLWKAVGTAGMYDRPVIPYIVGTMTAFKRDDRGELKKVWAARCSDAEFLSAPDVFEQWTVLKDHPEKAAPLLDAAVRVAAQGCGKTLAQMNR